MNGDERRDAWTGDRTSIAIVLLLVQATVGLVALAGMAAFALAGVFPALTPAGLVVLLNAVLPAALAAGVACGRDWGRQGAILFEVAVLLSALATMLLDRLPHVQIELTLTALLTGVCLPIVQIILLRAGHTGSVLHVTRSQQDRMDTERGTKGVEVSMGV